MATKKRNRSPKTIWAYAYQILPPQPAERLGTIQTLLDHEHADAKRGARTWTGRVVLEEQITHIMVVSDSPEQHRDVNRRLEAELQELQAGFAMTAPMAVEDDAAATRD
ncbi:MAG TPA: hypothetical protein VN908_08375 [Gemmatimonadales bacterium]|nr:hypothetical protein [Gemmatimonadales bacterium]